MKNFNDASIILLHFKGKVISWNLIVPLYKIFYSSFRHCWASDVEIITSKRSSIAVKILFAHLVKRKQVINRMTMSCDCTICRRKMLKYFNQGWRKKILRFSLPQYFFDSDSTQMNVRKVHIYDHGWLIIGFVDYGLESCKFGLFSITIISRTKDDFYVEMFILQVTFDLLSTLISF